MYLLFGKAVAIRTFWIRPAAHPISDKRDEELAGPLAAK